MMKFSIIRILLVHF